jgi:hypothetical protein
MKMQDIDMAALDKDLQKLTQPEKHGGWFRRNWKWVVPLDLLVIVVAGAAILYWVFYTRVYNLDACSKAMLVICSDPTVLEALGDPVTPVSWPSRDVIPAAREEENEVDVIWHVQGPKGRAKAHVQSRKRQGNWDPVILEVTLPSGKKISVRAASDSDRDAKPWVPGEKSATSDNGTKAPETKKSDLNKDFEVPDDLPPGVK